MAMAAERPRRGARGARPPIAEINVTPLVDVMLVLLVVFMITAPLLTSGVSVNLPEAKSEPLPGTDTPITVTVDGSGRVFLLDREVELGSLGATLDAVTRARPDQRIFVRGDTGVHYGRVMEVIGEVTAAGYTRIALVTQPADRGAGR